MTMKKLGSHIPRSQLLNVFFARPTECEYSEIVYPRNFLAYRITKPPRGIGWAFWISGNVGLDNMLSPLAHG